MTKRRGPGKPPPDTVPDRDAVERALEAALDHLRPGPGTAQAAKAVRRGRRPPPGRPDGEPT